MQIVRWTRVGSGLDAVVAVPAVLSGRMLTEAGFAVTAGSASVPFAFERLAVDQLDIALVVTSDASAGEPQTDDAVRAALVEFVAALPSGVRVGVVGDDPPRSLTALTDDRATLSLALRTQGVASTLIEPALRLATDSLVGARRAVVVMVGPGLPDAGAVPAWWPEGVALYAARAEPTDRSAGQFARNATGGFSTTRPPASLVSALDAITTDLMSQYRVTVANVPAGVDDLVIRVRVDDTDSQATIVLAPARAPSAPAALPEASPATASDVPRPPSGGADPPWLAVFAVAVVLALLVGAAVAARRRDDREGGVRNVERSDRTSPAPAEATVPVARQDVTVVLSARDADGLAQREGTVLGGDRLEIVWTPADALREVIRRRATTLVIEPGTDDPGPLVHAVANHDRSSGCHTRIVQVSASGTMIDLTAPDKGGVHRG